MCCVPNCKGNYSAASYSICDVLYWQHNIATQRDYAMRTCALFEI